MRPNLRVIFLCAVALTLWLGAGSESRAYCVTLPQASGAGAAPAAEADTVLLWPFTNRSGNTSLDWIGESFVIELREQLEGGAVTFVSRQQRAAAVKLVGAPPQAELSHATLIGIGQQADARWLITGWYSDDGETFRTTAWVFDLQREHLVELAPQSGPLADLEAVQRRLARAVRQQIEPGVIGEDEVSGSQPVLPLPAYESYVRAQLASSPTVKLKELQVAAHFAPADPRVESALGDAYYSTGDDANAYYWLSKVPASSQLWPQASFFAALAEYRMGRYARAAQMLDGLQQQFPLPSVTADLAAAKAQSQHPVSPAPTLDASFPISAYRQLSREVARFERSKLQSLAPEAKVREEIEAAQKLLDQGGLDAAALELQKAASASRDPESISTAYAGLAEIWMKRHNRVQAEAALKKALTAQADNPRALAVQRALAAGASSTQPVSTQGPRP